MSTLHYPAQAHYAASSQTTSVQFKQFMQNFTILADYILYALVYVYTFLNSMTLRIISRVWQCELRDFNPVQFWLGIRPKNCRIETIVFAQYPLSFLGSQVLLFFFFCFMFFSCPAAVKLIGQELSYNVENMWMFTQLRA